MTSNSTHLLSISFFSPVHIGTGDELEPLEYLIDQDGFLYTFSLEQVISDMTPVDRERLLSLQKAGKPSSLIEIRNLIRHSFNKEKHLEKIPATPKVQSYYDEKIANIENLLQTWPFIKTMNQPYIPGSSLKGAIRTALLNLWVREGHRSESDILDLWDTNRQGRKFLDIGRDAFKYLKVPDIPLPHDFTFFGKVSLYSLDKDDHLNETKIPLIREVTASRIFNDQRHVQSRSDEFQFKIKIDERIMKRSRGTIGLDDLTFSEMWQSLDFYESVMEKEAQKWSRYNESVKQFYEKFKEFLEARRQKQHDIKLIKIGFGSGFEAVTIEKIRDDTQQHGKSVSLLEGVCPLGWAVLQNKGKAP